MDQTRQGIEIKEWMSTADVQELISKVAGQVAADMSKKKIPYFFLGQDIQIQESRGDIISTIASELTLFILEDRSNIQNIILSGDCNPERALRNRFINYCLDKARAPDRDPYRYLYKRASDILRQSNSFYTRSEPKKGMAFSLHSENRSIPPLSREDLETISWPPDIIDRLDYEAVNRKSALLELATYFWNQTALDWGNQQVWIDLRDLVTWIGLHVPLNPPKPKELLAEDAQSIDIVPDTQYQSNEIPIEPEYLSKIADCTANLLGEREKEIFYYRRILGQSLKDIAEKLDYKGSSGPKYYLESAENKLRRFLRDKPGLAPHDLDDKAFAIFRKNLSAILKKTVSMP
jgi:hypothetical protein